MSKNKFWKKENEVVTPISDDADLENTVTESLPEVNYTEELLPQLLKAKELETIQMILDVLETFKSNMLHDFKTPEAQKAAKWLREELKKKGYELE